VWNIYSDGWPITCQAGIEIGELSAPRFGRFTPGIETKFRFYRIIFNIRDENIFVVRHILTLRTAFPTLSFHSGYVRSQFYDKDNNFILPHCTIFLMIPLFVALQTYTFSSVSSTGYGLDGPGIESRWGWDFSQTTIPALGPIQPPVQWVAGLFRG
jgi:hypothetical protein